jgi:hypothetical protein
MTHSAQQPVDASFPPLRDRARGQLQREAGVEWIQRLGSALIGGDDLGLAGR